MKYPISKSLLIFSVAAIGLMYSQVVNQRVRNQRSAATLLQKYMLLPVSTMNFTILFPVDSADRCLYMVFHPVDCSGLFLFFRLILKKDMAIVKKQNQC